MRGQRGVDPGEGAGRLQEDGLLETRRVVRHAVRPAHHSLGTLFRDLPRERSEVRQSNLAFGQLGNVVARGVPVLAMRPSGEQAPSPEFLQAGRPRPHSAPARPPVGCGIPRRTWRRRPRCGGLCGGQACACSKAPLASNRAQASMNTRNSSVSNHGRWGSSASRASGRFSGFKPTRKELKRYERVSQFGSSSACLNEATLASSFSRTGAVVRPSEKPNARASATKITAVHFIDRQASRCECSSG